MAIILSPLQHVPVVKLLDLTNILGCHEITAFFPFTGPGQVLTLSRFKRGAEFLLLWRGVCNRYTQVLLCVGKVLWHAGDIVQAVFTMRKISTATWSGSNLKSHPLKHATSLSHRSPEESTPGTWCRGVMFNLSILGAVCDLCFTSRI